MTNNTTLKFRVGQLKTQVDKIDDKVEKIMENHLPHVNSEIKSLKTEVRIFAVLNIVSIILAKLLL